jgi:uncharacterized Ntn-hydrolase superfamily protein
VTFSLAARCRRTGMFGVVVTSSSPAVAARCAQARAGVGAACTQNITDPSLGHRLLDALAAGLDAQKALDRVVAEAPYAEFRQLSVVDVTGNTAAYSGERTLGRHRTAQGRDAVAAGNLLADEAVPQAMVDAFAADPDAHLGDRLLAALSAGRAAGGEEGPVRSCGVVIVDKVSWPVTDLRVDWSEDPISDLAEAWAVWKPQAEDYVTRALNPSTAPSYGVPGDI